MFLGFQAILKTQLRLLGLDLKIPLQTPMPLWSVGAGGGGAQIKGYLSHELRRKMQNWGEHTQLPGHVIPSLVSSTDTISQAGGLGSRPTFMLCSTSVQPQASQVSFRAQVRPPCGGGSCPDGPRTGLI